LKESLLDRFIVQNRVHSAQKWILGAQSGRLLADQPVAHHVVANPYPR